MKTQRLLLALCISLAVSAVFTFALSRYLQSGKPKSEPTLTYIAPSRPLEAGEVLKAGDFEPVTWPKSFPIANSFTKAADLVGRTVLMPVEKGQPILLRDVSSVGAGAGLAAKIPDGMRAISLRSDEVVGVGGFLNPGSHVDVLVTYRPGMSAQPMTATALQNAQVLAAGQKAEPDPTGKPQSVTVVTLLLTPDDAERAVLASTQGTVHFVLRNNSDLTRTEAAPMQLSTLAGVAPALPHVRAAVVRQIAKTDVPGPELEIQTVLDGVSENADTKARGSK